MQEWIKPIKKLGACEEALEWCEDYETLEDAWANCKRGDWMLWLLGKSAGAPETDSRKKLVFTVCQCARLALPYIPEGEERPLKAIEIAEAWTQGKETLEAVKAAAHMAYAAYIAYAAAHMAYAADAAHAAAHAGYLADAGDAAYAATHAAYMAYVAAHMAYAGEAASLKRYADIVRQYHDVPSC